MNRRTPKTLFAVPSPIQEVTLVQPPTQNVDQEQLLDIMVKYTNKQVKKEDVLKKLAELEDKLSTPS